jgi:hypothetical protein
MLQRSDNRPRCIRTWKDAFEGALRDKAVSKALALLYVVNDVLQCPNNGFRWQEDFGMHLCDVFPKALACARDLRAHDVHHKMTRMPDIWRNRRVLRSDIADRLVDYCYDSTQELGSSRHLPPSNPLQGAKRHQTLPIDHQAPPCQRSWQASSHHLTPSVAPRHSSSHPNDNNAPERHGHHYHNTPHPSSHLPCHPQSLHSGKGVYHNGTRSDGTYDDDGRNHLVPNDDKPSHPPYRPPPSQSEHTPHVLHVPSAPGQYARCTSSTLHAQAPLAAPQGHMELEQARFDVDEAVGLLQLVKKVVLERKLRDFEQTHAGTAS